MNIEIITNYERRALVEMPYVPRVGERIQLSNMPYMYDERNGESPEWVVTGVKTYIGEWKNSHEDPEETYEGTAIYIKNEEDE